MAALSLHPRSPSLLASVPADISSLDAPAALAVLGGGSVAALAALSLTDPERRREVRHGVCLDVLIHYPQNKADGMIAHLASLADRRLLLSFAPKTFYYSLLKRIGELFPGPSKATRAYLHSEKDVERALEKVGWKISKRGLVTTQFYFSRLIEAVPAQ
ncbi:unnamed protein product [Spirodela intermedia]|uniref:Magnesium-protoporphyrin IX methyltransferase C-terminal domain-containing protein n=1 Tax=Spirodela intermedia TaxID=51605 RepID=A0A7I8J9A1_SPIIN|nr:unnamed protein product [Spirodela intermedia]CAA6666674.1 unnamed protein product [Spirodela intermedia]